MPIYYNNRNNTQFMRKVLDSGSYYALCESQGYTKGNAHLIVGRELEISDGKKWCKVNGTEIVELVNGALAQFSIMHPVEYSFISHTAIMYLLDASVTRTMCVDKRGVIYINVGFLYQPTPKGLDMNVNAVMNILYHECMHIILEHLPRAHKYRKSGKDIDWKDLNIAADLEVNGTMVIDGICSDKFWRDQRGCYSDIVEGLPMETIFANHRNLVNSFKNTDAGICPEFDLGGDNKKEDKTPAKRVVYDDSTKEFRLGHAEAMKACNEVLKKAYKKYDTSNGNLKNIIAALQDAYDEITTTVAGKHSLAESLMYESVAPQGDVKYETFGQGWVLGIRENATRIMLMKQELENLLNGAKPNDDDTNIELPIDDNEEEHQVSLDTNEEELLLPKPKNDNKDDGNGGEGGESGQDKDKGKGDGDGDGKDDENSEDDNDSGNGGKEGDDKSDDRDNEGSSEGKYSTGGGPIRVTRSGGKPMLVGGIVRDEDINGDKSLEEKVAESLRNSGFDESEINSIKAELESIPERSESELAKVRDKLITSTPNTAIANVCRKIKVENTVVEELWEEIIKNFLERNTTYAAENAKKPDEDIIRWGNKRTLAHGIITPYHPETTEETQHINILIDTSGSINRNLASYFIKIIAELYKKLKYSGVNMYAWASKVDEKNVLAITEDMQLTDEQITNAATNLMSNNEAGGGTDICKAVDFMLRNWKNEPTGVWLIFTDGEFGTEHLKYLLSEGNKYMFVVYTVSVKEKMNQKLKVNNKWWAINPEYSGINRVFIDMQMMNKRH